MAAEQEYAGRILPALNVQVIEKGDRARPGWVRCTLGDDITFKADKLVSYFFAPWNLTVHDALLVAAAVEFCDRIQRRPSNGWGREFKLHIPVHDPCLWNSKLVSDALHDALQFLTGDRWDITFYNRGKPEEPPRQSFMDLGRPISAVIPFSGGLDSHAVAGLIGKTLGDGLVRVHLGTAGADWKKRKRNNEPFTAVPYSVKSPKHTPEPSARNRGFKFTLLGGLAAYLAKANTIILPESGQGALGPTIIPVGQAYVDYRNHPLFTAKMETLLYHLLGHKARFMFPQLWHTKGETLRMYIKECGITASHLANIRSCWQGNRHVSVDGKARQCGICAACMLRRMSLHAAGITEPPSIYAWEKLGASTLEAGVSQAFRRKKITHAIREYAIAGTLHMDHLAALRHSAINAKIIDLTTFQLAKALSLPQADVQAKLNRFLMQHEKEWKEFMRSLGPTSFVAEWAVHGYDRTA